MPENIFKIYPPKKGPSKDGRRGSGLWSEDSPEKRFEHVKRVLDIYYDVDDDTFFDDLDLAWFLKNAVIGNIYFSEKVVEGILGGQYWPEEKTNSNIKAVISAIIEGNTYADGSFREELLQVRKWLGNDYHNGGEPLRFEHVVPAKVYLEELKKLYRDTCFFMGADSQRRFEEFRKKVAVCIVTEGQDEDLNDAKLRESMPDGWIWETGDMFARYNSEKLKETITIHFGPGK